MCDEPERDYTWNERMACELCAASTLTEGMVEAILEAAAEMKTVRLKTLLGQCLEIIIKDWDEDHHLVPEIREALK